MAGGRQVLGGDGGATGSTGAAQRAARRGGGSRAADPDDIVVGVGVRRDGEIAAADVLVGLTTVGDLDYAICSNRDLLIFAAGAINTGKVCNRRPIARVRIVLGDRGLETIAQRQAFRHLSADGVILISGNGDGRQYADDRNHDHQFDERETLLHLLKHSLLLKLPYKGTTARA